MSVKEQGPNQTEKHGGGAPTKAHPSASEGKALGQNTGGVGNLQDEPQSADEAKKRAAEKADDSGKRPPDPKGGAY